MSAIDALLENVAIPKMLKARQLFPRPQVRDVPRTLSEKIFASGVLSRLKPGQSVAVTAGSRGIAGMPDILKTIVSTIRAVGGSPFVFPAMGSHGGATAEGQASMLAGMGITEESIGSPIKSSMETVTVGECRGKQIFMDKYASEADFVVVVNRVKPHVAFRGACESGIMKMITIGMGKHKGAESAHLMGFGQMAENIVFFAKAVIERKKILFAVGILENAYHETAELAVLKDSEIEKEEPLLLRKAWELYPKLFFEHLDVLVLDEIGKDISGTGFDTNVLGRYHTKYASGGPSITRVSVLDITDKSHGNGNGLGLLDFTTRRAFDKFNFEQSYPNSLTTTVPLTIKIPMVLKNDMQAIQAAIKTCNVSASEKVTMARIKNTVSLDEIEISESLGEYALKHPNLSVDSEARGLSFDEKGNLF
jgi:hypothetical protein